MMQLIVDSLELRAGGVARSAYLLNSGFWPLTPLPGFKVNQTSKLGLPRKGGQMR